MIYVLSGGGRVYAAIGVTYPSGSSCTCSKDGVTRRAADTGGKWIFPVTAAGTYTISCTNGTDTATKTVSITAQGQVASVTLAYWNGELYDNGNQYTTVTGGWALGSNTAGVTLNVGTNYLELSHSNNTYRYMKCTKSIDVTNFTKATLVAKNAAAYATLQLNVGAGMKEVQADSAAANDVTIELDISGISGLVAVSVGSKKLTNSATFRMHSLKLS